MTASTVARGAPDLARRTGGGFTPNHPWDRNFFLFMAGLIWLGIVLGFGPEILQHAQGHGKPFPLIVHFHAAAFLGWLALFTGQVLLIRAKRRDLHRRLGFAMVGLALVMMVLGPATALIADHGKIGTPDAEPEFLAVQFSDILAFVGLLSAAVAFRNNPSAHKRLVLISTIYIADAGFARWLGGAVHGLLGPSPFSYWASLYGGTTALFLGIGLYDLVTRRRLHPAYLAGLVWVLAMELTALSLYATPAWKTLAARWIAAA
jgi:uncharacterized membrane protein